MSDFEKVIHDVSRKVYWDVPEETHLTPASEVRRVLRALRATGWAVVPRKATKEMAKKAEDYLLLSSNEFSRNRVIKIWAIMFDAGEVHDE